MTTNPDSKSYKENFLRLKNCVFIGGPSDDVIAPWQSALFGFWNSDQSKISKDELFWMWYGDRNFNFVSLQSIWISSLSINMTTLV